ncbi:unnamed protein product [Phaedon cochleariae]|uniref:Protein takeout n=1 Tax=Phaedon cochleariae TaxID=80249 RepID=A0A9N9SEB2_PHACE|nr:unnamed protein product [Phaedon cochleariae]
MGFCVKVVFFLTVATIDYFPTQAAKLPSTFGRCSITDSEFDECLRKNAEDAIKQLKNGSPELGFSSFDPLDIPKLVIGEGTGPVHVAQNFRDIKLYGLTGSIVHSASVDFEKKQFHAKSTTPELRLQGMYSMKGRVLLLPIVGDGPCNVTLVNTKINHTISAQSFDKKGKTYWKITDYTVTLRPDKVTFKFDNLFNGDQRLGDEINKVLNDNWSELFTDVRGGYEESFGLIFQGLADRVFSRVALKDIFLDMN